jgi:hypothetical protein
LVMQLCVPTARWMLLFVDILSFKLFSASLTLCHNPWTKTLLIVSVSIWAGCMLIFILPVCADALLFWRIAGVDQGRGTLTVAKNISRLTMWEVVLFLTVSSHAISLDTAVHRIVAHVKRWVAILV